MRQIVRSASRRNLFVVNTSNPSMKKTALALVLVAALGCRAEPMSTEKVGQNGDIKVELLFMKDGIKMYRFYMTSR